MTNFHKLLHAISITLLTGLFLAFGTPSAQAATYVSTTSVNEVMPDGTQIFTNFATSDAVDARINELGITGVISEVQIPAAGYGAMFLLADGSWVVDANTSVRYLTSNVGESLVIDVAISAIQTRSFGYTSCIGTFNTPHKVSGYLYWGATSDCRNSTSSVYRHELTVGLYDTCVGSLCVFLSFITNLRAPEGDYSKLQVASGQSKCENLVEDRTYEQKATVVVRGISFGSYWERDSIVYNCDIQYNP